MDPGAELSIPRVKSMVDGHGRPVGRAWPGPQLSAWLSGVPCVGTCAYSTCTHHTEQSSAYLGTEGAGDASMGGSVQ